MTFDVVTYKMHMKEINIKKVSAAIIFENVDSGIQFNNKQNK